MSATRALAISYWKLEYIAAPSADCHVAKFRQRPHGTVGTGRRDVRNMMDAGLAWPASTGTGPGGALRVLRPDKSAFGAARAS